MTFKQISLALIVVLTTVAIATFESCKKSKDVYVATSNTSIFGRVVDDRGNVITGAVVTTGSYSTTTDFNGVFFFNDIKTDLKSTTVNVSMYGYFNGSRTLQLQQGQKQEVQITLLNWVASGQSYKTIGGGAGGTVTFSEGITMTFPTYSVKDKKTGVLYYGIVRVNARKIDPTTDIGRKEMPGDLIGLPADGSDQKLLESYGMVAVSLYDAAGNELQIADGKEVQIGLDIPTSLVSSAPATIPLWYYDEDKGKWVEEGSATMQGTKYVGNVKHFSFWNCDMSIQAIQLEATFVDQNNNPLSGLVVTLTNTANGSSRGGTINSKGWVGGWIPASSTLNLIVFNPICGSIFPYYSQTITTGSASLNLGTIQVTIPNNTTTITGTVVDCNSQPLGNSLVYLGSPFNTVISPNASSGTFSYNFNCTINSSIGITAYDLVNNVSGYQARSITLGTNNNVGNIVACGTVNPFFKYILKNNTTSVSDTIFDISQLSQECTFYPPNNFYISCGYGDFSVKDSTVGTFNITQGRFRTLLDIPIPKWDTMDVIPTASTVTFTNFPSVGNVEGSFKMNMDGSYPNFYSYTATGSFRVPRK